LVAAIAMSDEVTKLLHRMREGDDQAANQLIPIIYKDLRRIAAALMRGERAGHTLQPTAVVHEAFVRLLEHEPASFESRAHFFAIAARTMRRLLVDHARGRAAGKRGGKERQQVELQDGLALSPQQSEEVLALHEALEGLEQLDARQAQIVEMHYFAGNSVEEIALVLDISDRTVKRELQTARLFLRRQLKTLGTVDL
jgi:RNA polymerase sigma factor (TIGR02999 family)